MRFKKLIIGTTASIAVLGTGIGVAVASWTVSGSGAGGGAATVANSLTITQVTPTGSSASLYPGGAAGPVEFEVANPNPFAVTITGVTWGTPTSGNPSACANANISLDAAAPTTVSISVPANATAGTVYTIAGVLDLKSTAGNGCEGQSFNIPMTISASSN